MSNLYINWKDSCLPCDALLTHFSEKVIMNSAADSYNRLLTELSHLTDDLCAPRPAAVLDIKYATLQPVK